MYYDDDEELPESVRNNLPARALAIYRDAFNAAWRRSSHVEATDEEIDREQRAHAAAWKAVRAEYKRRDGRWVHLGPQSGEFPETGRIAKPVE